MRNFYKVQFGYSHGKKFTYVNDCRKIEGFFQCKLIPVTENEALSLPLPPGASYGKDHQYFIPTITNSEQATVTEFSEETTTAFKTYDYTDAILGGNEFLLTDKTLKVYKVTPECAKLLLSNMFFMTVYDHEYYGDGSEFNYGCPPYDKCMYGNVTVNGSTVFTNDSNGEISFFANVWSKDGDKPAFDNAYVVFEYDKIVGGYYSSLKTCHEYETRVEMLGQSETATICNNPDSYDIGNNLNYTEISYQATTPKTAFDHYSWGNQRENLLDAYYQFVFIRPSTRQVLHNAFLIKTSTGRKRISKVYSSAEEALRHAVSQNHDGTYVANQLKLETVNGWNDKSNVAVQGFTASSGLIRRITLSWQKLNDNELVEYDIYKNGKCTWKFNSNTTWHTELINSASLIGQSLQYSIIPVFRDYFGFQYGLETTATGICTASPVQNTMHDLAYDTGYTATKVSFLITPLPSDMAEWWEFEGYYDVNATTLIETAEEDDYTCFIVKAYGITNLKPNEKMAKKTIYIAMKYRHKTTGAIAYTNSCKITADFLTLPNMIGSTVRSTHNGNQRTIEWTGCADDIPEQMQFTEYAVIRNSTLIGTTTAHTMTEETSVGGQVWYDVEARFDMVEFGETMHCVQHASISNGVSKSYSTSATYSPAKSSPSRSSSGGSSGGGYTSPTISGPSRSGGGHSPSVSSWSSWR